MTSTGTGTGPGADAGTGTGTGTHFSPIAGTGTDRVEDSRTVVGLRGVTKEYAGGVTALRGVDLTVAEGELLAIVGPSGSGKSTLLHIVGTLDRPTTGSVHIAGHDVAALSDRRLSALRAQHVGFVFQAFHLVPGVSARDNVAEGLLYSGLPAPYAAAGPPRRWSGSDWRTAWTTGRTSSRAARSSGLPSRGRWWANPPCYWPTSRRGRWTRRRGRR